MMFKIQYENFSRHMVPTLTTELIGYFSIDGNMQYNDNLTQLKYYISPPDFNNVNFNLDINFESTRHKPTEYIKLDDILKWILSHFHQFVDRPLSAQEERWLDIDFISSRGTIKKILSSPYSNKYEEWIICASKYRGTIYLCAFYTDEKERQEQDATMETKRITSWGYKFEQYMLADDPSRRPDPLAPLNECEKFHCMFRANFGRYSLLYGAEVDGICSQERITEQQFLTDIDETFELIELKTIPRRHMIGNNRNISSRLVDWWSQNYLVDIKEIICGLKVSPTNSERCDTVTMIKEYRTDDLPKISKYSVFDVNKCKIFCKMFLDKVKKIVTKDHNECMYKFYWKSSSKRLVSYSEEAPDNKIYLFLQPWFLEDVEKYLELRRAE
ncbi:PREDICTED: decapping and exoribonuclease protein [Vollenhovia emeryi]|uniref:decapping and exoribonuclease protein n=1 Tax=Vollenhovia emeryi TaxID=411798 RepID=UPI0005F37A02|nr:PREDICTED: decapping and exoribonuclease protein [Vollenhovia emeryi]